MNIKDFMSISLVGCVYRLTTKVLARRMTKVVGRVVAKCQHAFVWGEGETDYRCGYNC